AQSMMTKVNKSLYVTISTSLLPFIRRLAERPMGIISAEGGIFGMMAGRYSSNINIDIFLKSYSGEYYSSARVGRGEIALKHPLLTMGLAVQPQVIADIMDNKDFRGRGLLARFLYSMPCEPALSDNRG
uniref:DUF3987 domain-containing protein n=1 Tax=Muricomes intestini TaxID=1796634 RepID=UPI002FDB1932